jgi:hypothetical protein
MATINRLQISGPSIALAIVLISFPIGCNRVAPTINTTVQGRVSFQGQPLAGGVVVFSPDPERGGSGKPIPAEIAQDGRFQLNIGAGTVISPGWYRVTIASAPNSASIGPEIAPGNRIAFPPQLARPDQSGLVREVKEGQENTFSFDIEVR